MHGIAFHVQVQWDEPSSIPRPERVSPWELEPLLPAAPSNSTPPQRNKRARPQVLPSLAPDLSAFGMPAFVAHLVIDFYSNFLFSLTGMWKSPVDRPTAFSYCDPARGRDLYPSPKLSSCTKGSTLSYNENSSLPPTFWSNQVETITESFAPVLNRETGEKRQGSGYRLFGIELLDHSTVEEPSPMVLNGEAMEDQPVASLDAESDQHSEPSNINRSGVPSVSCEPEKSCLRSPLDSQSRQIRSCTKVLRLGFQMLLVKIIFRSMCKF